MPSVPSPLRTPDITPTTSINNHWCVGLTQRPDFEIHFVQTGGVSIIRVHTCTFALHIWNAVPVMLASSRASESATTDPDDEERLLLVPTDGVVRWSRQAAVPPLCTIAA